MKHLERCENQLLSSSNINQHLLSLAEDLYGRIMDDIRDEVGLVLVIASQYQKPRCIRSQRRYERD